MNVFRHHYETAPLVVSIIELCFGERNRSVCNHNLSKVSLG